MAGGDPEAYALVAPLLIDLAYDERAVQFVGAPGTGHFVKLVHNAIEFGMVQAIAEGSSCSSAPASRSTCRRCSTTGTTAR
jgi:6-phosphogluconate dehydrogenase